MTFLRTLVALAWAYGVVVLVRAIINAGDSDTWN